MDGFPAGTGSLSHLPRYLAPMIRRNLPNLFTLGNLLCGVLACALLVVAGVNLAVDIQYHNTYYYISVSHLGILVLLGALFDVLDGAVARWLRVSSPMGAQLDSLADLVTFGVAPALLLFHLLLREGQHVWAFTPLLLPLFSAWRLARFNVRHDVAPSTTFEGLPTPANGLYICALTLALQTGSHPNLMEGPVITVLVLVQCFLLVSRIPFLSLKGHTSRLWLSILLLPGIPLIWWLGWGATPFVVMLYLIVSLVAARFDRNRHYQGNS